MARKEMKQEMEQAEAIGKILEILSAYDNFQVFGILETVKVLIIKQFTN